MAITPITRDVGKQRDFNQPISTTLAAYTFAYNNAGDVTPATSASKIQLSVMFDQTTTGSSVLPILCVQVDNEIEFIADCNTNTAQAMVGVSFDLVDEATVDNSVPGMAGQVICTGLVGTPANRQMIVRVNPASLA